MPLLSFTLAGADPMTVLSLINTAHGTPQSRPAYLADVALHPHLSTLWHQATKFLTYYYTAQQETA